MNFEDAAFLRHYDELKRKAAMLDLITEDTRLRIDDGFVMTCVSQELVLAATGLTEYWMQARDKANIAKEVL